MGVFLNALLGLPQGGIPAASFRVHRARFVYAGLLQSGARLTGSVYKALRLRRVYSPLPARPRALPTSLSSPLHLGF